MGYMDNYVHDPCSFARTHAQDRPRHEPSSLTKWGPVTLCDLRSLLFLFPFFGLSVYSTFPLQCQSKGPARMHSALDHQEIVMVSNISYAFD